MADEGSAMSATSAGESDGGRDVTIAGVTKAKSLGSKVRYRKGGHGHGHGHPRLQRRLSKFERHYSKLQMDSTLIPERRRIDYVLVYPLPKQDSKEPPSKKERRNAEYRRRFEQELKKEGFAIQEERTDELCFVKLHCPFKRLCAEAQKIHLELPLKGCEVPDDQPRNCISRFERKYLETDDEADFVSAPFFMDQVKLFQGHEDPTHFFRPALRSFLTNHILINMDIRTEEEKSGQAVEGEGDADDAEEQGDNCCVRMCGKWCMSSHFLDRPQTEEEEKKNVRMLKKRGLPYLLMKEAYTDAFILHEDSEKIVDKEQDHFLEAGYEVEEDLQGTDKELDSDPRKDLDETWTKPFKYQPLWKIRNYFGEKIAFYFAWSGMLITTLWIPTLFGIAVFFYGLTVSITSDGVSNSTASNQTNSFVDDLKGTVDDVLATIKSSFDNTVTPYFALVICLWGTVFLEMWKRKNATLAYEWDVDNFETNEPDRPQFYGTRVKKDPVTEDEMWFYPFKRQFLKFFASTSVLIFMMTVVMISVVMVIVYRIIMSVDYCPNMSSSACLVVATVSSSLLNAVSILLLGKVYDYLAVWLTRWENHRTQTRFDDSLIIKLFAFQFVNSYSSLFYIAFIRSSFDAQGFLGSTDQEDKYRDSCSGTCMSQLSFQVLVLMLAKPFPKFLKDIVLPLVKRIWRRRPSCCCRCKKNQVDGEKKKRVSASVAFLDRERLKPDLQDFTLSEYTEKVIQYGFLMLFAAAFPLAPLLALLTNLIDIRVDGKRMLWWYRRPIAYIAQDIGKWYDILTFVNFVGVLTNAFVIAFTSSWGQSYDTVGKLWIVVAFEHIVFLLKYILAYLIPDVPNEVTMAIRREKYQVFKLMEDSKEKPKTDYAHLVPANDGKGHVLSETKEEDEEEEAAAADQGKPPSGSPKGENSTRPAGFMSEMHGSQRSDKVSVSNIRTEEKESLERGNGVGVERRGAEADEAGHADRRDRQSTHRYSNDADTEASIHSADHAEV